MGHVFPLALLFLLMVAQTDFAIEISSLIKGLSGLAILAGITRQKMAIVHNVSHRMRISIEVSENRLPSL
jgi:hypothetical protein